MGSKSQQVARNSHSGLTSWPSTAHTPFSLGTHPASLSRGRWKELRCSPAPENSPAEKGRAVSTLIVE